MSSVNMSQPPVFGAAAEANTRPPPRGRVVQEELFAQVVAGEERRAAAF